MATKKSAKLARDELNRQQLETCHLVQDIGRRTVRGSAVTIVSQLCRVALQFITVAVLARLLFPSDFGLLAMAGAVSGFVAMFTELGLSSATVQRKAIEQNVVSAFFFINLYMGAVIALTMIVLAPAAAWFFGETRLTHVIMALAPSVMLVAGCRQHAALLQRRMRWLAIEAVSLSAIIGSSTIAILLAWTTPLGYWALVAQNWTFALLTSLLTWAACPWRPTRVSDWRAAREPLGFGLHLTASTFFDYLHRQFDDVLVGWRWGAGQLGYYNRAYALLLLPLQVINNPLSSVVIPALSRLQDQPERWHNAYLEALTGVVVLASAVTSIFLAVSLPIVLLVLGPNWEPAGRIFAYLSISMLPGTAMNAAGWIYISLGQGSRMSGWALKTTPVWIGAFLIGLPFGPEGVALSYSIAVLLLLIPCFMNATRFAPVELRTILSCIFPPLVAGAVSGIAGNWLLTAYRLESEFLNLILFGSSAFFMYCTILGLYCLIDQGFRNIIIKNLSMLTQLFRDIRA